jgi:transcriptional regulator with XRE-family HTH domain
MAARERWGKILKQGMRAMRRRLGLTQKALATSLGVSAPLVSLIEQGKRRLTPPLRQRLLALAMRSGATKDGGAS